MGFDQRNGVVCGCMQMVRQQKEDDTLYFLPCWIEMDDITFAVYEHADELPLVYIFCKDFISVTPSPLEPEGLS